MPLNRRRFIGGALAVGGLAATSCTTQARPSSAATVPTLVARPALNEWPSAFWRAPAAAQEAYRYAVGARDVLRYIPCYCGCGADGHRSNFDCFVDDVGAETVTLDAHGFG